MQKGPGKALCSEITDGHRTGRGQVPSNEKLGETKVSSFSVPIDLLTPSSIVPYRIRCGGRG